MADSISVAVRCRPAGSDGGCVFADPTVENGLKWCPYPVADDGTPFVQLSPGRGGGAKCGPAGAASSRGYALAWAPTKQFVFDHVFGLPRPVGNAGGSQAEVFESVRKPLHRLLEGVNTSYLLYGSTASGKTFTSFGGLLNAIALGGRELRAEKLSDQGDAGLASRVMHWVFKNLQQLQIDGPDADSRASDTPAWAATHRLVGFSVRVSLLELYKEALRDLLVSRPLTECRATCPIR